MRTRSTSSWAAGIFLASYSLVTGLYPEGLSAGKGAPVPVHSAALPPAPAALLTTAKTALAAPAAVLPAAMSIPAKAEASEPPQVQALPRIVAVDRRTAERTDQLRPNVKKRLAHVARALPEGVTLLVTSAYRTHDEQAALQPTFGVKAAPGTSTHEHGRGIDLNVLVDGERVPPRRQQEVIGEVMSEAGFRHLGPADPVHYSIPEWDLGPEPSEELWLDVPTLEEARSAIRLAGQDTAVVEAQAAPSE